MNFISQLAHAESLHERDTSQFVHILTQAYIAVPLYVALHVLIYFLLKNRKKIMVPVLMALNLGVGVLTYSAVPALSVLAISVGIISALAFSFLSIANG